MLRCVGGLEGEEEGYGVGSAGDGYADAVAGFDVSAVEGEGGGCGHAASILAVGVFVRFEWREWVGSQRRCE